MGKLRFVDMQQEDYRLRNDHKEALSAAVKCQEDLNEAGEMVKRREASILEAEKEKEHARPERDKARVSWRRPRRPHENLNGHSK